MPAFTFPDSAAPSVEEVAQNTALPTSMAELHAALADFEPIAMRVIELKRETLEKEAQVLATTLERITRLIPVLSKDCEAYYRRMVVILTTVEKVQTGEDAYFYSERKLALYENGSLVEMRRYGESTGTHMPGWELTEERPLTASAAVGAFGFNTIAAGIVEVLKEALEVIVLTEEMEARLMALTKILETLCGGVRPCTP